MTSPEDRGTVSDARRVLSAGGATLDVAWQTGHHLGLDDAVTLALDGGDGSG
jgi:hypothetical protein